MPSELMQRQIDRLLNEAEEAIASQDWPAVGDRARSVLSIARAIKIADKLHRRPLWKTGDSRPLLDHSNGLEGSYCRVIFGKNIGQRKNWTT
jgi:hypothetical protein